MLHESDSLLVAESSLKVAGKGRRFSQPDPYCRPRSVSASVIIPAHNEENYIAETLEALAAQTYQYIEVIVVANGCTDRTEQIARPLCHKLVSLEAQGLSRARNLGVRVARGSLLIFLDADTKLEPQGISRIVAEFTSPCAMGTLKGLPDTNRFAYRFIYFWKNLVHRSAFHYGSSGVILCWKEQFIEVGGFDEELHVRENSELMYKLAKFGSYKYIHSTAVTTSMRRYEKRGARRTVWLWLRLWLLSVFSDIRKRPYETVR